MPVLTFIGGPMDGYSAGIDLDDLTENEAIWFSYVGAKCKYRYRVRLGDLTARLESQVRIEDTED